jgi:hypothetical protein
VSELLRGVAAVTAMHPAHPCRQCRYCGECGCERGGLCNVHQTTPETLEALRADRARYEAELLDPALRLAIASRDPDRGGRIHDRGCREVRRAVASANDLISHPEKISYNVFGDRFPHLVGPTDTDLIGRRRCSFCAPDVQERKRPPRPKRLPPPPSPERALLRRILDELSVSDGQPAVLAGSAHVSINEAEIALIEAIRGEAEERLP